MRIITGKARGLKLRTPAGFSTRPTADRIKESLFNILGGLINFSDVDVVLDIFAGTGALGLESISRGARSAIFVDAATTEIIRENLTRAKFDGCKILRGDFRKILPRLNRQGATFGLIFSDPPYATDFAQISLDSVAELNLLVEGGLIAVEHAAEKILQPPKNFQLVRQTIYGHTTAITILERKSTP